MSLAVFQALDHCVAIMEHLKVLFDTLRVQFRHLQFRMIVAGTLHGIKVLKGEAFDTQELLVAALGIDVSGSLQE